MVAIVAVSRKMEIMGTTEGEGGLRECTVRWQRIAIVSKDIIVRFSLTSLKPGFFLSILFRRKHALPISNQIVYFFIKTN